MIQQISFETSRGDVAENYERFFVPAIGAPLAVDLVGLAALRPGERVLDIACGTGVVARLAGERVGADGTVAGVDLNPGMLAVARARSGGQTPSLDADAAIDWYEAGAEALPFRDRAFDVAFCQLGLQFFAGRAAALREMHRVLTPGGRLALNVPGPTPAIFAVLESALARHIGSEAAAFVEVVFSLHDPAEVTGLLSDADFVDVDVRQIEKTLPLPPPREFLWQYVSSTPLAGAAAALDDDRRAAIEREFAAGCRRFVEGGTLVLRQPLTVATARR